MGRTTSRTFPEAGRKLGELGVPLNVWPVVQATSQQQRAGRYPRENRQHPGKMIPELARRIVAECSRLDDLVVDPLAGTGTSLVEAAALGRRCVGVELEPRWVALTQANLDHILTPEQRRLAEVRQGDAHELPAVLEDLVGRVDLVVTSPPYAGDAQTIDKPAWLAGGSLGDEATRNYSRQPANIARAGGDYYEAMARVYEGCYRLLRPGGLLVTVTKNTRPQGRLVDLTGITVRLARTAGFAYTQHIVALHAALRDGGLVARPSLWQLSHTRRTRAAGRPAHLVAHEDLGVFTKPTMPASSQELTTDVEDVEEASTRA